MEVYGRASVLLSHHVLKHPPVFRVLNKGLETFALLVMGSRDILSLQGGNMGYYQTKFGYIGNPCKEFLYVTLSARVSCCFIHKGRKNIRWGW